MRMVLFLLMVLISGPAMAQGWTEPARGTPTRAALMDALRPHALWLLGSPVEFVVYDLRVSGNLAFASVYPQRPGGARSAFIPPPVIPAAICCQKTGKGWGCRRCTISPARPGWPSIGR